jgi:hypothetical protein
MGLTGTFGVGVTWGVLWNRAILWGSLALVALGLGFMGWLITHALGPEPGAKLVLMGMPCVAGPTFLAAVLTVSITRVGPEGLSWWEWQIGRYVGWPALVLAGIAAALG